MNIHFSGIGGIGISALAQLCRERGDRVTGSEMQETVILPVLRKLGIRISLPQKKGNVPPDTDILIYSEAVPETNPERQFAREKNIPQKSYFEYLGEVSRKFRTIAVCGTHGKTSTVAMMSAGFSQTSFDPTGIVGTTLPQFENTNFHAGTNDWLLVEACEYRQNFRFLNPEIVVLVDLDYDHPDAFPTEDSYWKAFSDFCSKAQTVVYHDNEKSQHILKHFSGQRIALSETERDASIFISRIVGEHNRRNACLALATAEFLQIDKKNFQSGLQSFQAPGRRQEYLGEKNGIKIYDDYAHHPTELKALFSAFREQFPNQKLAVIFEPHQHARTIQFFDEFVEVLQIPDFVGIYPIYPARDNDEDKQKMPTEKLIKAIPNAVKIENIFNVMTFTEQLLAGTVLLFVGAGKVDALAHEFFAKRE